MVERQPVVCPKNPTWLRRMLEVLPPGLRGKLEPFEACVQENPRRDGEGRGRIRPAGLRD